MAIENQRKPRRLSVYQRIWRMMGRSNATIQTKEIGTPGESRRIRLPVEPRPSQGARIPEAENAAPVPAVAEGGPGECAQQVPIPWLGDMTEASGNADYVCMRKALYRIEQMATDSLDDGGQHARDDLEWIRDHARLTLRHTALAVSFDCPQDEDLGLVFTGRLSEAMETVTVNNSDGTYTKCPIKWPPPPSQAAAEGVEDHG